MKSIASIILLLVPAFAFAQGSLTPPGLPAPTMKTLDQLEPRTPLQAGAAGVTVNPNGGYTLAAPGSYYLTANLTVSNGHAIILDADSVTLDLNGFTLATTTPTPNGTAIHVPADHHSINIRNGHITGSITIGADGGIASGSGFAHGIYCAGYLSNGVAADLTIQGIAGHGIYFDTGSTVERCAVAQCGDTGIRAQVISGCSASNCGDTAIMGDTVSNCRGSAIGSYGIYATVATNCYGFSTKGHGIWASGTATFCYGGTNSTTHNAIYAGIAVACLSQIGPIGVRLVNGKQLGTP